MFNAFRPEASLRIVTSDPVCFIRPKWVNMSGPISSQGLMSYRCSHQNKSWTRNTEWIKGGLTLKKRDWRKKNLLSYTSLSSWFPDNAVRPIRRYLCTLEYLWIRIAEFPLIKEEEKHFHNQAKWVAWRGWSSLCSTALSISPTASLMKLHEETPRLLHFPLAYLYYNKSTSRRGYLELFSAQ